MGEAAFFRDDAKKRAAEAVKAVESATSAEVVIAVRRKSGDYRAASYHFGFVLMGVVFAYMLVSPRVYSFGAIALEGLAAFVVGAVVCASASPLRRLFVRPKTRAANVRAAGHATFYDLGISKTSGRNGILVFVSTFERTCAVVPDIGIDPEKLGPDWQTAQGAIAAAVGRADLDGFLEAVKGLGPVLGATMPRTADDVNELPDEVQ
jgi:putative membrane protein